jgi:hypothetical protein
VKVASPYKVRVVVDPAFGEQLASLPVGEPVWVIDTPINAPVAHRLWRERNDENHLTGITTFKPGADASPEEEVICLLDTIEEHHGEYSADPPHSILEIIGCPDSERLRSALAEFGFRVEASKQRQRGRSSHTMTSNQALQPVSSLKAF